MLKVGCVFWIATKQTETSWQAGEAVGKLGYSRLWELERSSLVWRRVGWDPTQGYKEWVVTAVEKCFWKSEKTDMLNPQEDRRMTQKNFALGASKPDFLSGNNQKPSTQKRRDFFGSYWKRPQSSIWVISCCQRMLTGKQWQHQSSSMPSCRSGDPVMLPSSLCTLHGLGQFKLSTRRFSPTKEVAAKVCVLKLGPFLPTPPLF